MNISNSNKYDSFFNEICILIDKARYDAGRSINSTLTATYWDIGRQIVEFEQMGKARAEYGQQLIKHLSDNLTKKFGKGFSQVNLIV